MNYSLTLFLNLVFRSAISILVWTLLIRPESIPQVPQPKVYPRYPQGINVSFDPTLASELQFTIDSLRTLRGFKGISVGVTLPNQGTWFGVSGISHAGGKHHARDEVRHRESDEDFYGCSDPEAC